jgi:hypothetical protein
MINVNYLLGLNNLTHSFTQQEWAVLAVYLLGGDSVPVDTEDVAIRLNEMASSHFGWRKHPAIPNLELVRVVLSDCKKSKPPLLQGIGKTGWGLTQEGLKQAHEIEARSPGLDLSGPAAASKPTPSVQARLNRERQRICATNAWIHWKQSGTKPTAREAEEVYRIDHYAVGAMRETKVTRLTGLFSDDEEMSRFLDSCAELLPRKENQQ